jgi:hypothetical protein
LLDRISKIINILEVNEIQKNYQNILIFSVLMRATNAWIWDKFIFVFQRRMYTCSMLWGDDEKNCIGPRTWIFSFIIQLEILFSVLLFLLCVFYCIWIESKFSCFLLRQKKNLLTKKKKCVGWRIRSFVDEIFSVKIVKFAWGRYLIFNRIQIYVAMPQYLHRVINSILESWIFLLISYKI